MLWPTLVLILAVSFAAVGSWLVAVLYRRGVVRLMSVPLSDGLGRPGLAWVEEAPAPPRRVTMEDNRRARRALLALLVGLSIVMAATSAAIQLALMDKGTLLSFGRWLVLTALGTWPVVVVLALVWRWSRFALLLAVVPWFALVFAVAFVRMVDQSEWQFHLLWLTVEVLVPLMLIVLLCLGGTTRAIGPWLLLPLCLAFSSSVAGISFAMKLLDDPAGQLGNVVGLLGATGSLLAFAVLPWLVIWWPLYWLGQALAGTYARKQLSELLMLFAVVWFIALAWKAANLAGEAGFGALLAFLPLAWVPPVIGMTRWWRERRSAGRPPTMLVLRVFRRDEAVQRLFDHVIERWRLSGNTVLIAAPDLLERTIDADAIFTFVDGKLGARFVRSKADIAVRVGLFDFEPDAEGRYRINECYCNDGTWQEMLNALIRFADFVLMDLRGFSASNAGCAYELGLLSSTPGLGRVVLLHDATTDQSVARALTAAAPPDRFVWLDISGRMNTRRREQVLEELLGATRSGAG